MKRHAIAVILLAVATFLAYSNSLNGTWAMDDVLAHEPPTVNDIYDLLGFRKVTYLTFFLNKLITPFRPFSFRLVNILIHIINSLLVYTVACKTLALTTNGNAVHSVSWHRDKKSDRRLPDIAFFTALLSAIIFSLHPLNINAVAYIIQRMASLSTTFVLLSLLIYIRARRSPVKPASVLLFFMSAVSLIIGIFSKENAVIAIPLFLLYDYIFLSRFQTGKFLNMLAIVSGSGAVIFGFASYFLDLHTVILDLSQYFLNPDQPLSGRGWMAVDVSWTPLEHVLTEFRVLSRYLFLFFLPLPRFLVFVWWNYPLSHGIVNPAATLFSILFITSLVIFSVVKIRRYPLLCFGVLWYCIAISLESFISLGSDLYFEHRNYLPLTGLVIGITGHSLTSLKWRLNETKIWALVFITCVVLGSLTFARNMVWRDSITLWEDTLSKNPSDYRVYNNLGYAYHAEGKIDKAIEHYRTAVQLNPGYPKVHNNLGLAYQTQGLIEKAIEHFRNAIELKPDYSSALYNLGNIYSIQGKSSEAIPYYTASLDINPANYRAQNNLGVAYKSQGDTDKAIEHYKRALELKPTYSEAYTNLGNAYRSQDRIDKAIELYRTAISLKPNSPEAHINLGIAYRHKGLTDKSERHLGIAKKMRPKMMTRGASSP